MAEGFDFGVRTRDLVPSDMIAVPLGPGRRNVVVGSPTYFQKHQRREDFTRRRRKGIDAQRSRRNFLLRSRSVHCLMDVLQRRPDLSDEVASGIGQRNTAGGAIEQAYVELALQLADRVAQRSRRQFELKRSGTERTSSRNRDNRVQFDQTLPSHCPSDRNISSTFVPIIDEAVPS